MKFFTEEDSVFSIIARFLTVAGVIFGIWAYFHSIYPVFQKENEFLAIKKDNSRLWVKNDSLLVEIEKNNNILSKQRSQYRDLSKKMEITRDSLVLMQKYVEIMSIMLEAKDKYMGKLLVLERSNKNKTILIELTLDKMANHLMNKYLMSIKLGVESKFNLREAGFEIAAQSNLTIANEVEEEAIHIFEKYIDKNFPHDFNGSIIEAIVIIPLIYRIEMCAPPMAPLE